MPFVLCIFAALAFLPAYALAQAPSSGCPGTPTRVIVTCYAPGATGKIQGPWATSRRGPFGSIPMTLDCVREGRCKYVTLASDPSRYGQYFCIGTFKYTSPKNNQTYQINNLYGYVHDTGGAFRGRPEKMDVALGDFRGWSGTNAMRFVSNQSYCGKISTTWYQTGGPPSTPATSRHIGSGPPFMHTSSAMPMSMGGGSPSGSGGGTPSLSDLPSFLDKLLNKPMMKEDPKKPDPKLPIDPKDIFGDKDKKDDDKGGNSEDEAPEEDNLATTTASTTPRTLKNFPVNTTVTITSIMPKADTGKAGPVSPQESYNDYGAVTFSTPPATNSAANPAGDPGIIRAAYKGIRDVLINMYILLTSRGR